MKKQNCLIITLLTTLFLGCNNNNYEKLYEYNIGKNIYYMNKYDIEEQSILLDSALFYLNIAEKLVNEKKVKNHVRQIYRHKIMIYSLKKDFDKCFKIVDTLKHINYEFVTPELIDALYNKIQIEKAIYSDCTSELTNYYQNIFRIYEKELGKYKIQIDSILFHNKPIGDWYSFLLEYYYYKSKIYGKDTVIYELESLPQGNEDKIQFIETVKDFINTSQEPPLLLF